ncbi:sulfatase [Flammeovirga sp. MY04]|nr:sulfatase [Flammeovirga sp. MY04]
MKTLKIVLLLLWSSQLLAQTKQPNVVFILADDLGINALGCYGNEYVETPNIDKLAEEGMRFTNGYSNDPTCAPSRASIMTGQYVPRHKIYRVSDRFKSDEKTLKHMRFLPPENNRPDGKTVGLSLEQIILPEAFNQNNYTSAGFGKWHLGSKKLGMDQQGFSEAIETKGHYQFKSFPQQDDILENEYNADYTTQKGIDFMKRQVANHQPFFLYMPYYLVHKPLEPKPETFAYFKEKYQMEDEVTNVLAMIKNLDESVGDLLNAIKELGIEEETIVVFTSDNGHYKTDNGMFNKPYRGYKGNTLEGGIRVPYIFKYPKAISPSTVSELPIIHVDIYPTLIGLSGNNLPKEQVIDGVDISSELKGDKHVLKDRILVWQYTNYSRYKPKTKTFNSEWVNVIQYKGYKMTEYVESGKKILFNLNEDPFEEREISHTSTEIIKELTVLLENWKKETSSEQPKENSKFINQ